MLVLHNSSLWEIIYNYTCIGWPATNQEHNIEKHSNSTIPETYS